MLAEHCIFATEEWLQQSFGGTWVKGVLRCAGIHRKHDLFPTFEYLAAFSVWMQWRPQFRQNPQTPGHTEDTGLHGLHNQWKRECRNNFFKTCSEGREQSPRQAGSYCLKSYKDTVEREEGCNLGTISKIHAFHCGSGFLSRYCGIVVWCKTSNETCPQSSHVNIN